MVEVSTMLWTYLAVLQLLVFCGAALLVWG